MEKQHYYYGEEAKELVDWHVKNTLLRDFECNDFVTPQLPYIIDFQNEPLSKLFIAEAERVKCIQRKEFFDKVFKKMPENTQVISITDTRFFNNQYLGREKFFELGRKLISFIDKKDYKGDSVIKQNRKTEKIYPAEETICFSFIIAKIDPAQIYIQWKGVPKYSIVGYF